MQRSVSVIIPTYNYGRFISEAIESVLAQTRAPKEIIVVDDGSTDDTAEVVARFGTKVRYVRQENAGVCAARNRGVGESDADLIAFLDADDVYVPTSLEKQVARFDEADDIGLVHCGLRVFDDETGETIRYDVIGGEDDVAENLLLWDGPVIAGPGAIIVSRRAFEAVNGFDTSMKVGEDWDFCYRVARKFKVRFVSEPLVGYRSHGMAAHWNVAEMERGMSRFYEKAFATDDPEILKLKRPALRNFHRIIAGSYFHGGNFWRFAVHALQSVWLGGVQAGDILKLFGRRQNNR
jgi:glycosyltransferase involved in cell wall biosynthesis